MSLWRMIVTATSLVGTRFGGAFIAFLSQVLLARLLPRADVGAIFLAMSASIVLSGIIAMGYPSLGLIWLPRYYALGRRKLVDAFHAAAWRDCLLALAAAAVAIGWIIAIAPLGSEYKTALLFALLSAPAAVMIRINSAVANSLRRYLLSYVPDFLVRPGLLLAFLALAWLLHWPLGVTSVLTAFVCANSIVALGQAFYMGGDGSLPPPFRPAVRNLAPQLRGRAASLVVVAIVANSFADLVNLIGGLFLPADEVAQLGVAIRLAALIGFVTQATQNFILPDLAKALTSGAKTEINGLLRRINAVALSAVMACVAGTILFGGYALRIFGPDYERAHWPLVMFTISQGLRAASGMNQHLLSFGGYQARTAGACIAAAATLMLSAALLSPRFGLEGMGIAVLLADLVWALLLAHQAQRLTGRRGDIVALLRTA